METVVWWAGGITTVLGLLLLLSRPLVRWALLWGRRLAQFWTDWLGEPGRDGVPERPGVMRRLADQADAIARIDAQLQPDSGRSVYDAIARIEAQLADLRADRRPVYLSTSAAPGRHRATNQ